MSRLSQHGRGAFDWEEAKRRLAAMTATLASSNQTHREDSDEVLERRARVLAVVDTANDAELDAIEVITFRIGDDHYALETAYVLEVINLSTTTVVPGCPAFLKGIANLRGQILALFDLSLFFGLAPTIGNGQILVLGKEQAEYGIFIDEVNEVSAISRCSITVPAIAIPESQRGFLLGITPDATLVLNGESLLNDDGLVIDEV